MMRFLVVVVTFIVILESSKITCFLQNEREGLVDIKSYFGSVGGEGGISGILPSWGTGDCCEWEGVMCSSSGHVTHLSLSSMVRPDQDWILNMTIFHPFQELMLLDLFNNTFGSVTHTPELQLENINSLPCVVLSSLKYKYIRAGVVMLKNLTELDLSHSGLSRVPDFLWSLTQLQILDLNICQIVGELDARVCELINIRELYLSYNGLNGSFPDCVWKLTSLRVLELSGNSFIGQFPSQIQISMPFLEWLSIEDNSFQGNFSLSSLTNHSSLKVLKLSNSNLQVYIEESSAPPKMQFQILALSKCSLSVHINTLRKFLSFQSNLQYIDLQTNGIVGPFPSWLLQNNSGLRLLCICDNALTGELQLPLHSHPSLAWLTISLNQLGGEIPHDMEMKLPALKMLLMGDNSFQGQIPNSIANMTHLETLELSNNNLSGKLPEIFYSDFSNLKHLMLSRNSLDGEIFPSYMNWPSLVVLSLEQNRFGGNINESLKISTQLVILDLSYNEVTGEVPTWIGSLSGQLLVISMEGNQLTGSIPSQICNISELLYLNLSENKLTGEIPSCGCPSKLSNLHLRGNKLTGSIPKGLQSCSSSLTVLDLGSNRLSGGVPRWINMLPVLEVLALKDNQLQGEMSTELCQLQYLNIFDVSNNGITGVIPSCLRNSSFAVGQGENPFNERGVQIIIPTSFKVRNAHISLSIYVSGLIHEEENFIVKSRYATYIDSRIYIMAILDLSSNQLSGCIPLEIGEMGKLNTLNLSHNHFTGPIPKSFSKLSSIESLDLSWNNLSGSIPSELVVLNFLEIFNVSYNNLSGEVPDTAQFANFDEDNYRGNPILRGVLPECCTVQKAPSSSDPAEQGDEEDTAEFDFQVFFWSFGGSFIVVPLTLFAVLCINPAWRRAWSAFLDYHFLWWL